MTLAFGHVLMRVGCAGGPQYLGRGSGSAPVHGPIGSLTQHDDCDDRLAVMAVVAVILVAVRGH
ncbi:MAG: hypothetical protein JWR10_917 [Rubritepida sp.]|nr:hypothetical protein [Rubritepida sp.]